MPPSWCATTLGVVFYTRSTTLYTLQTSLSIISHKCEVWGATVPLAVRRVIPDHHTSDPKIATDNMYDSTALTSGPRAAPLFTELIRLTYPAALRVFAYQVVRWHLKSSHGSRYKPNHRMCSTN